MDMPEDKNASRVMVISNPFKSRGNLEEGRSRSEVPTGLEISPGWHTHRSHSLFSAPPAPLLAISGRGLGELRGGAAS